MKTHIPNVKISSIIAVVPEEYSNYDDEVSNYNQAVENSKKLKSVMGYDQHRVISGNTTTSDLLKHGFNELTKKTGLIGTDFDALVLVTQTPDYILPPTSSVLHGWFGLAEDAYCVDINQGCNGYIMGLVQAGMLLQNAEIKRVLLCVGDTLSTRTSKQDRNSYPLIGDAAALTVVEFDKDSPGFEAELMNRGSAYDALIIPAGGARNPSSESTNVPTLADDGNTRSAEQLVMQGADVFNFTQTVVPDFLDKFISSNGLKWEQIQCLYLHQANSFIIKKIAETLNIDTEKVPDGVVGKYGNSSSATIPLAIAMKGKADNLEMQKVVLSGFGVGLSWGAILTDLKSIEFAELITMNGA